MTQTQKFQCIVPIIPPLLYTLSKNIDEILYPEIKLYNEGYLQVSDLHKLWYAEFGNAKGLPVVVLHGGPGASIDNKFARFFDSAFYHIILFDQRGAGKSTPAAEMQDNNTQNLIDDIEQLRNHLKIDKWLLFGGNWGSTLAIAYGEKYPDQCIGFILRGIFLVSKEEINHLWYGIRESYPEYWHQLIDILPKNERSDLIKGYYKKLMDPNPNVHLPAARAFIEYDLRASLALQSMTAESFANDHFNLNVARTFTHYCVNEFFFKPDQILDNINKISHLPSIIIHGRHDIICRTRKAYELFEAWSNSELIIVQDGGHASMEPPIADQLTGAANKFRDKLLLGR